MTLSRLALCVCLLVCSGWFSGVALGAEAPSGLRTDFCSPLPPGGGTPLLSKDRRGMSFYSQEQRRRFVRTTAYTHSENDHLIYGRKNAVNGDLQFSDHLRSAAADWSVYPVGTKFRIKGQPALYIVDDYGGALVGTGTIDLYHPTRAQMRAWGCRVVEIEVLEWGSPQRSLDLLAARRRSRHCLRMYAALKTRLRHCRKLPGTALPHAATAAL
ncbi:MAG: 3D domain-containing protein [Akkermansia sp.]